MKTYNELQKLGEILGTSIYVLIVSLNPCVRNSILIARLFFPKLIVRRLGFVKLV